MKIYFIGIAGAGMHSLALYLSDSGHEVTGSDPGASDAVCAFWRERGAEIHRVQKAENIEGAELVIYSAAVPANNPERAAAEKLGIGCSRGDALARFANEHKGSIAVCGTHGKGTTAAAILRALNAAGYRVSDILGAVPVGCRQPSLFVPDSDFLVCEVDESDRTNQQHRPAYLLLNNVEEDHLNVYKDLNDIVDSFADHIRKCLKHGTKVVIHYAGIGAPRLYESLSDCPDIAWVAEEGLIDAPALAYNIDPPDENGRCTMTLREASGMIHVIQPTLGGRANAQNIASAIGLARVIGIQYDRIAPALAAYEGLRDRCQIQKIGEIQLVTDYASHPTCIKNDIAWVRKSAGRIIAVYHPYRYSLMNCHWKALAANLSAADIVLLAPFDGAGEPPIPGLDSEDLARRIIAENDHCSALAFPSFDALESAAKAEIRPGDCLIIFGGGPLFNMGKRIASAKV